MNITKPLSVMKQASRNLFDVLSAPYGSFAAFRMVEGKRKGMPKTDAASNVDRYVGWVYDAITKNSAERAAQPLRLYATRATGQSKAGTRSGIGKRIGRTIIKQERMQLAKSTIGQSARFRSAAEIEEIEDHPFLDLWTDGFFDCMMLAIFEELTGNSYTAFELDALGRPSNLTVFPSQYVTPILTKGEGITAYKLGRGLNTVTIPAELMVHNKFPNPKNPYIGMAPLTAAALAADRDMDMDIYEGSLNANMGRPDFAVVMKGEGVQRKDVEAYKKQWMSEWGGVSRAGRPFFAGGDIDIKNFGFSPREMAFLQGRKVTMEQIFGAFGVPVALGKTEGVPRANLDAAILQWTRFTILPRLRMFEAALNRQLIPLYDEPRLFVAYDNPVPEDREYILKERETNLKNFVTTVNEERAKDGLPPVDWGDVPVVPSTGLPLGSTITTSANQLQPEPRSVTGSTGGIKSRTKAPTREPDDAPDISGGANPQPNSAEKEIMAVTDRMQQDQGRDLTSEFDRVAPDGAYDTVKFDSTAYAQTYLDDAMRAMKPVWERGLIVGNIALPNGSQIDVGAFIGREETAKAIEKQTLKFLESEGDSVKREFVRQMQAGIKNGENVQELRKRLTGMFSDERRNARSLVIARTESARAIELGREASWQESGVVSAKVWDANGDSCPFCQAMHGRIVELGQSFWSQGDVMEVEFKGKPITLDLSYSDTPAPPLHPACRCVLEPQFIEA